MTTTAEVSTTFGDIVTNISAAVAGGADADKAKEALRQMVNAQSAGQAPKIAPVAGTYKLESKVVIRPNGTEYHSRSLGKHDDIAALRMARTRSLPALAYGPPGTGKTAMFEAAFSPKDSTEELYIVLGTGDTEVADFIGGYIQNPDGTFSWEDGPLLKAMENGAALLVDEIALIDPKVMAVVYSVMDGRGEITVTANPTRGTVKAKDGFYIVGACNPNAPGAQMSEALLSRFPLQFEVGTDYALAKALGVPAKMVTAAQNLQRKLESGEVGWAPQLRECLAFRDVVEVMGEDIALSNLISSAPEMDRASVQDVLQRSYGRGIVPLSIT